MSATGKLIEAHQDFLDGRLAPADFWRQAREHPPIFIPAPLNAWIVSRFDDVKRVLSDEDTFKHLIGGPGSSVFRDTLLDLEGEKHRQRLGLVGPPLKSRGSLEGHVRGVVDSHAKRIMSDLRSRETFDVARELNEPVPLLVITDMLDVPAASEFRGWYLAIASAGSGNVTGDPDLRAAGQQALDELYDFLDPIIQARRQAPAGDLLSKLVTAEFDGATLSDGEIKSFTALILVGGVETSARSLTNLQRQLFRHPEHLAFVDEDHDRITAAAAESLRHAPPVTGLSRWAPQEAELGEVTIPQGDRLYASIYSANRDEIHFDDPDEFVITRFADDATRQFSQKADHLAFGSGRHFCTGALLARLEMELVMNTLLDEVSGATIIQDASGDAGERLGSENSLLIEPAWR
jgi:cytochrome P450